MSLALFTSQTLQTVNNPNSVAIGDLNGDGKNDIAVVSNISSSISILFGNGDGTFQDQQTFYTGTNHPSIAIGDLNGDGKDDLAVVNSSFGLNGNSISILTWKAGGTLQNQQTINTGGSAVAIGDLNGDGRNDLALTHYSYSGTAFALLANADGTFQTGNSFDAGYNPVSVAIGDITGDDKNDLAVADTGYYNSGYWSGGSYHSAYWVYYALTTLYGNGDGSFKSNYTNPTTDHNSYAPVSVAIGDIDGDGINDVATLNSDAATSSYGGHSYIFYALSNGGIPVSEQRYTSTPSTAIAMGDLNGDGKTDLVATNADGTVSVWLNNTTPPPAHLSITADNTSKAEGNHGSTPFTFTVTRSGNTNLTSSISYSVTGSGSNPADALDFAHSRLPSGTVKFAVGETSKQIVINVAGDTRPEPDEGFTVTLSNPSNGTNISTANATQTILNSANAPVGANKIISLNEDGSYALATADFGFSDPNDSPANSLLAVKIATLPAAGALKLNGVAVTAGQSILAIDIAAGKLAFTPAANANGANYAQFSFQVQDNGGTINGGTDLDPTPNTIKFNVTAVRDDINLIGTAGDDTLNGDRIDPGSYDTLSGMAGNDILNGLAGKDTLLGGAGDDTLNGGTGADSMDGGTGNDSYTVDNAGDTVIEAVDAGTDTVTSSLASYTLTTNVENLSLSETGLNGTGNDLNNILTGNAANNTLNGAAGIDTLIGGQGNDTYLVDSSTDIITEKPSGDTDTVQSSVSYTLGSNLENLTLTRMSAINGIGNALDNILTGNAGNNALNGGLGKDTLTGSGGTDTFVYTALAETGTSPANCDLITDFSTVQGDKIDVKAIDANTVLAGTQAWSFVEAFTGAVGQVSFGAVNHLVLFDQNGDKAADFAIKLTGVSSLAAADFIFA